MVRIIFKLCLLVVLLDVAYAESNTPTVKNAPIMSVSFSPDGKLALSGSSDGTVKLQRISLCSKIRMSGVYKVA